MPLSATEGKEITVKTRNGEETRIEMGRAYFVDQPNDAEGPLVKVCPPQLTTVLFIPIGVDKSRDYLIKALFISVDSRGYAFNKRDDYSVHVVSNDREIVIDHESILKILEIVDAAENKHSVAYKGTRVAVHPWMINLKQFSSIIPTEIKLFNMACVPKKFLKYFFGYPHHDLEVAKRSRFPIYEEIVRGISPRVNREDQKKLMLEKFHKLFAMLNVNNAAKLERRPGVVGNNVHPYIPVIPFIRKEAARGRESLVQEIAISLHSPRVGYTEPENSDGDVVLDITLNGDEYDLIADLGGSISIFSSTGVVFHIDGKQFATVPEEVYAGNPPFHLRPARLICNVVVVDEEGQVIDPLTVNHAINYIIDGRNNQVRHYINTNTRNWINNGYSAVTADNIIDFSDGYGYELDEVREMVRTNGLNSRRQDLNREELLEEDDEYPYPEEAYDDEDYPEPELGGDPAVGVVAELQADHGYVRAHVAEVDGSVLRVNLDRAEDAVAQQVPEDQDVNGPERGEMVIIDHYRLSTYNRDMNGMSVRGVASNPLDPGQARLSISNPVLGNSEGRPEPVVVLKVDFNSVSNVVTVDTAANVANVNTVVDVNNCATFRTVAFAQVIEQLSRSFPACIFRMRHTAQAAFSKYFVSLHGNNTLSFMIVPNPIAGDEDIHRVIRESRGAHWLGGVNVVFDSEDSNRIWSFSGQAVLLPAISQVTADIIGKVRTTMERANQVQ